MAGTKTYFVWVTLPKSEAPLAEQLASKMVRRGFTIGPLGRQLVTLREDNPACMVAFSVYRAPKDDAEVAEYTTSGIYDEVCNVIKVVKGKFFSVVVAESSGSVWNTGNIGIAAEEAARLEATKGLN